MYPIFSRFDYNTRRDAYEWFMSLDDYNESKIARWKKTTIHCFGTHNNMPVCPLGAIYYVLLSNTQHLLVGPSLITEILDPPTNNLAIVIFDEAKLFMSEYDSGMVTDLKEAFGL